MKQKIILMLALLTFSWVQINAQQQIFTPDEIITKVKAGTDVKGLAMKVTLVAQGSTQFKATNVSEGSSVILNRGDNQEITAAGTFDVTIVTFVAGAGTSANVYTLTCKLYVAPKEPEPESPCNRHYESAVKFIVDTPVVHPFTVNGKTGANVIFSPGNLQYRPATNEWRFALRQFDRVAHGKSRYAPEGLQVTDVFGNSTTVFYDSIDYANKDESGNFKVVKNVPCNNLLVSKTYQGWIDLFGWATSGQGRKVGDEGAVFFYPYDLNQTDLGYENNPLGYGPSLNEGRGEGATNNNFDKKSGMNRLFDWGYANYIREYNGSVFDEQGHWQYSTDSTMYHTGIWRTLTKDEWDYLLFKRPVAGDDSAFSIVRLQWGKNDYDTVSGMILYPDDFSFSEAGVAPIPLGVRKLTAITAATWETLQEAGCVFLPCSRAMFLNGSNERTVSEAGMGFLTRYWSSTASDEANKAYYCDMSLNPSNGNIVLNTDRRHGGYHVRMVQDYFDPCGLVEVEFRDTIVEVGPADKTFKWEYAGKTREVSTAQKEHYDTLYTSEFGCDSVIFHLTFGDICESITQVYKDTTVQLALTDNSFTWEIDGQSFKHTISTTKTSEEFKDTLRTEHGCDSIFYTLTLHYPEFTVAAGTKVTFSPGNLQYKATSSTNISWRFGPNQYDRRMADNASPSATANKWMDLFAWGTSGIGSAKKPYETSTTATNYSWSEWGDNKIGDYAEKTWRTPKQAEWAYLFDTRKVNGADGYSYVRLKTGSNNSDTVTGVLIYPDDFTWAKAGVTAIATGASAGVRVVDNDTWKALEKAGCAFLPGCSMRTSATSVNTSNYGLLALYWSADKYGTTNYSYCMYFDFRNGSINTASNYGQRYYGYPVRLIRDITQ